MWVCASQLKLEIQVLDCCIQFWNTWIHLKFGKPNTISFNIIVTCHLSLQKRYKNCYRAAANPTLVRHLKISALYVLLILIMSPLWLENIHRFCWSNNTARPRHTWHPELFAPRDQNVTSTPGRQQTFLVYLFVSFANLQPTVWDYWQTSMLYKYIYICIIM